MTSTAVNAVSPVLPGGVYLSQSGSEHVEGVPKHVERHQTGASVVGKPEHPMVRPISRQGLNVGRRQEMEVSTRQLTSQCTAIKVISGWGGCTRSRACRSRWPIPGE